MQRKTIIIIITAITLLGILVYLFGFEKNTPQQNDGFFGGIFPSGSENILAPEKNEQSAPPITEGDVATLIQEGQDVATIPQWSLIPLGKDPIISLVAFGTTTRYHKNIPENLGHLFERSKETLGEERRISNLLFQQALKVVWSSDGQKSILWYLDDASVVRKFLIAYQGTSTPKTRFIENSADSIVFSPDSKSVAFIQSNNDSHDIYTAKNDFSSPKNVFKNKIPAPELAWLSLTTLSLKTKSSYAIEGFLYTLSLRDGFLTKIINGLGLDVQWNTNGSSVAYSISNESGEPRALELYTPSNNESKTLPFVTVAEKCIFGKKNPNVLYCGVPKIIPDGKYPDDWWQGKISFKDNVVAFDLIQNKIVADINTVSDVTNLTMYSDDSYLFFIDKNTARPWAVKLVHDAVLN